MLLKNFEDRASTLLDIDQRFEQMTAEQAKMNKLLGAVQERGWQNKAQLANFKAEVLQLKATQQQQK